MMLFQYLCYRKRSPVAGRRAAQHRGMMLIEVMVAVLILVIGMLGLMAAFAQTTTTQTDVDNRATAARLTQSLVNQITAGVDRSTNPPDNDVTPALLAPMAHNPTPGPSLTGVPAPCEPGFASAPSANPIVLAWLGQVTGPGGLPGATAAMQQIVVGPTLNQVTVTVCWQASGDSARRQHVQRAYIN